MITYLSSDFFSISQNRDLFVNIPGFSLVFFTKSDCPYCTEFLPIFKHVSSDVSNPKFAIMDVDQDNMRVVRMSARTNQKIEAVPYVVFYVNGIPTEVFNPDENSPQDNAELLRSFIKTQINKHNNGTWNNTKNTAIKQPALYSSLSKPYIGGRGGRRSLCYLTVSEAYEKKP